MPPWTVAPFVGLLLAIALLPLVAEHWWHRNRNKALVGALFGIPAAAYVGFVDPVSLGHTALEYLAFVSLLGSLFAITGGIRIRGTPAGTPISNSALLATGAVLANLIGTTGAAMLLLRPFLAANRRRQKRTHLVIFFIFVVANIGGCLTPLGDPPLFLGFLKGVPFQWTLTLWKEWAVALGAVLLIFSILDQIVFNREGTLAHPDILADTQAHGRFGIDGSFNFLLLLGVIGVVLAGGLYVHPRHGEMAAQIFQCLGLIALSGISLRLTRQELRRANEFSWHPFVEVVVLFAGIFAAMIPALAVLREKGPEMGLREPWHFFWATGSLSAFLDNAPTYLAFLATSQFLPDEIVGTTRHTLAAISCGAVFFGAMTYIGNGPNFMVKAVAEHAGVKMPSFFGYMAWSAAVLLPLFALLTLLFFR
ncbi:MAG: sodium:proton antiporter [Planctomycetes bacterium]|nr:sodium:proton antiporter [Planctomycetota bacterium]